MKTDWIVLNGRTGCMECRRCTVAETMKLPVSMKNLSVMVDAFILQHRNCK